MVATLITMTPRRDDEVSPALLRQMVSDNDDKQEEAHKRLRVDVRSLQSRTDRIEMEIAQLRNEVAGIKLRKPDASELRFPLQYVVTIVVGFLGIAASIWAMNSTMKEYMAAEQQRLENLKETVQRLDRQQQLQYAEFQTFRQEMARREQR